LINVPTLHIWEDTSLFAFPCKYFDEAQQKMTNSNYTTSTISQFNTKYAKMLKNAYNITISNDKEIGLVNDLVDSFVCGYVEGHEYPEIQNEGIDPKQYYIDSLEVLKMKQVYINYWDEGFVVAKIKNSKIIKRVFSWMDYRIQLDKDNQKDKYITYAMPKYVIFSAHDDNIAGLQTILYLAFHHKLEFPSFAASINMELYINDDKQFKVKVLFNDIVLFDDDYDKFKIEMSKYLLEDVEIDKLCIPRSKKMEWGILP